MPVVVTDSSGDTSVIESIVFNNGTDEHILYQEPIVEVSGSLPLAFTGARQRALDDYTIHGTAEGAGVETENLILEYLDNSTIGSDGVIKYNETYDLALAEVENGKIYSTRPQWSSGNVVYGFFMQKPQLNSVSYDSSRVIHAGTSSFSFTAPITGWVVMWSVNASASKHKLTIIEGSTAPTSYIPYGYQIPLTNTSGVTKNLFDTDTVLLGYEIKNNYITQKADWFVSDFIEVNPNTHYIATLTGTGCLEYTSKDAEPTRTTISQSTGIITLSTTHYLKINAQITNIDGVMFIQGSTAPDHYIPHRYTADYPLYIGSTKLGAEEYVDYESGKVYKRTENYFPPDTPVTGSKALKADGSTSSFAFWITTDYIPVSGRTFTLSPVASNSTSTAICAYDSDKNLIKGQAYGTVSNTPYDVTISCDSDVSFIRFCYYTKVVAKSTIMLVPGSTAPAQYIPYLQPTDPPVPFPAITAYQGENTLSSTETVGEVTVKGRLVDTTN